VTPRRAYTLPEVAVAAALAGVLAGLLVAAAGRGRHAAARARCQNHLRQQGLAVLTYEAAHGALPPAAVWGPNAPLGVPAAVGHGLWPYVLPHLGEPALAALYRWDGPADAVIAVLRCPASAAAGAVADYGPVAVDASLADFGLIAPGTPADGALAMNARARLTDITDGTSTTLLLTEAPAAHSWAAPAAVPARLVVTGSGPHPNGFNACMADGSVRLLRTGTAPGVVAGLLTRAGGEPSAE
jgi:prepilin-type processing-associated H-X9-DG protein